MIVQPIVLPTGPINQIVYRYIGREEQNTTDFMAKLPSRILHTEQICGKQVIQERSYTGKELCKEL